MSLIKKMIRNFEFPLLCNFFQVHLQSNPLKVVCRDQFRTNPNLRIVDFSANAVLQPLLARTYCSGFKYCYGYGSGPISVLLALMNVYGSDCWEV